MQVKEIVRNSIEKSSTGFSSKDRKVSNFEKSLLIYDGNCNICNKLVDWVSDKLPNSFEPIKSQSLRPEEYGLKQKDFDNYVWLIMPDRKKLMESDEPIDGVILGFNRGGCILEVANVQGFVPMSQLVTIAHENLQPSEDTQGSEDDSMLDGSEYVGKPLTVKVLEVNRARNRAIFSERSAMKEQREAQKAELIQVLEEGEIRKGRVTGISNFGAFVDLGGADGLIHISELSWGMVNSPEEIVSVGQEIDVFVLKVDKEGMKIALSLRRIHPEPWDTIAERYQVGDIVQATITKLADFGAFARLEDSIEGLIHVTEISNSEISHPQEVVSEGDLLDVKILRIESDRKRLGLSIKQAQEGYVPDQEEVDQDAVEEVDQDPVDAVEGVEESSDSISED